jgi:Zn-dependent protease
VQQGPHWAERPEDKQFDAKEGEYLPPDPHGAPQQKKRAAQGMGAVATAVAVALAKFKTVLLVLLNFKWAAVGLKALSFGGSFFLSLFFYAMFWGWKFALVFVFMILAHELGHYVTIRNYGLPARLPMFVPFVGAYTVGGVPENLEHDAYIALAGPLTGLGVSAACFAFGYQTHDVFWYMAAYVGAMINLFNMIPAMPFDGGRVAGALSPSLWIGGVILFVIFSVWLRIPLFFVLLLGLMALPGVIATLRGYVDPRYAGMTAAGKFRVGGWYLATIFALFYLMSITHVAVPRQ